MRGGDPWTSAETREDGVEKISPLTFTHLQVMQAARSCGTGLAL